MKFKKRMIQFTAISIVLLFVFGSSTSKFDATSIMLSSVNDKKIFTTSSFSWTNATVISDDNTRWNNDSSTYPSVAVDGNGTIHVVWQDDTDGDWGIDTEIMYANYTAAGWSNATPISDVYGWNNGSSTYPSIAVDCNGTIHVVWQDDTDGEWGSDTEIMYANYTAAGWSNATVISDDYTGWNDDFSEKPSVAVDDSGNLHVVWEDRTNGEWGSDTEIMYANYTTVGWSNATVISDDSTGWNNGNSGEPSVAVDDNGNVHVVWHDVTDGEWGSGEAEIMYANYTAAGWSNATVISDDYTGWNDDFSYSPSIAVDSSDNVHVFWEDFTDGEWGSDMEIMYANNTAAGWSNATVISDDATGWNDGSSSDPSIAIDGTGNLHVVWTDSTYGEWGGGFFDSEIMYANYTASGWSNATVISDDYTGWNNYYSFTPTVTVDSSNNLHVVWTDDTDGEWGTDYEIMYAILTERPTSNHPTNITTTVSSWGAISWQLYDDYGSGQYRVWVNDTNDNYYIYQDWQPWINTSLILITINTSASGRFNYIIEYYDYYHQFGISDSVIVTITDITPTKDEPIIIAPQGGGDISSFLLSPLGLGIIAGFGAVVLILAVIVIKNNKTIKNNNKIIEELKKTGKTPTSKKTVEK